MAKLLLRRSVCVVRTTVESISTDTERRASLSAIGEPLVLCPVYFCLSVRYLSVFFLMFVVSFFTFVVNK